MAFRVEGTSSIRARGERLIRVLPRPTLVSVAELVLLALIAVQAARLFWILMTPLGPVGDYRGSGSSAVPVSPNILAEFDPFFRLAESGAPVVVTSLSLKLHGVREDRATGRGSAIIALPGGTQQSFAVGDEIVPGARLVAVAFDNVTIERGGVREQIFLDQSGSAPAPGPSPPMTVPMAAPTPPVVPAPQSAPAQPQPQPQSADAPTSPQNA